MATILIVDDDIAVQATIRLLLERAGHSVVVASNARKALAAFDAGDFDLLLLDIFMPDMDGLETMRLVRQRDPLIPIIVISGQPMIATPAAGPYVPAMATTPGAIRGIQKPFKPATLMAAVADCLGGVNPSPAIVSAGPAAAGL